MTVMKKSNSRKAAIFLANKLRKALKLTQRTASLLAWAAVKKYNLQLITFTKKNKEVTKRVVSFDWLQFNEPKGERSKPSGLNLLTDFFKLLTGVKNHTISTYSYEVL